MKAPNAPSAAKSQPGRSQPGRTVERLVEAMTCLADDTRLRLLRILEQYELGVGELGQILQLPQPTVSRHLKTLSDAGFVVSRREGTSNLYHMLLEELEPGSRELWQIAREQTAAWPELEQDHRRLTELLREKLSASRVFFAGAAAEWDRLRAELYGEAFTVSAVLSLLPRDARIADLACGTGTTAALVAPFVPQGRVLAVDNSPEMLAAARGRCQGLPNVTVYEGDLTALPREVTACDAALLLLALTYVPDPQAVMTEAARVLKPGGRLVVVDLLPHAREDFRRKLNQLHSGFSMKQVSTYFTAAGLLERQVAALTSPPDAKGPGLFLAVADAAN